MSDTGQSIEAQTRRTSSMHFGQQTCSFSQDRSLRHSAQALTSWAIANAKVEPKGNAIITSKQASGSAKIDPLMAAFNAIALMSTNP
jgi:phage terminase large subunit-like protein